MAREAPGPQFNDAMVCNQANERGPAFPEAGEGDDRPGPVLQVMLQYNSDSCSTRHPHPTRNAVMVKHNLRSRDPAQYRQQQDCQDQQHSLKP